MPRFAANRADTDTRVAALIIIGVNYHPPLESVSQEVGEVVELERVSRDNRQIPRMYGVARELLMRGSTAREREREGEFLQKAFTQIALFYRALFCDCLTEHLTLHADNCELEAISRAPEGRCDFFVCTQRYVTFNVTENFLRAENDVCSFVVMQSRCAYQSLVV